MQNKVKSSGLKVMIRGAGEVASGIAYRLHLSGFKVCLLEVEAPVAVTRGTTFSEAVYDRVKEIMGVRAELVPGKLEDIYQAWERNNMPVVIDPEASMIDMVNPDVVIDAMMAKRKTGTRITDAPLVIGVGPGFYAGKDVHIVVESNHSAGLGKVLTEGEAEKNTGIPVEIGGLASERVVWSQTDGVFTTDKDIGDSVVAGEIVGHAGNSPVEAPQTGMLRGLMRNGTSVKKGYKLLEVDTVHDSAICNLIAHKVLMIGEGVLQAIKLKFDPERS
jgi:xanthine dehydrogenase accessory factor